MTREAKETMVASLAEKVSRVKAGFIADYSGLDVHSVDEIRKTYREANVDYTVIKNTLMKLALKGTAQEALSDAFSGPIAIAFSYTDEAGALGKATQSIAKKFKAFEVKGGFINDEILDPDRAVSIMAALPTLDEARAQLAGLVNAPAQNLLAQLNAPASNLIGVIKAKSEKDEAATTANGS